MHQKPTHAHEHSNSQSIPNFGGKTMLQAGGCFVIELHITPGCAWSVWETMGGLQPRLDSLGIPPEFITKFRPWKEKWCSDFWEPKFIGRKEYDAEGRAHATELQRAVGDRFHIVFRHWVSFDSNQWRTEWREEDLVTGETNEFWIEDDLPEGLAVKVVKIYPDCNGTYLWDLDGCCIDNTDPVFPDNLDARFTAWSETWDACFDVKTIKVDKAKLASDKFDERGLALAVELKREIGEAARVIYYCNLSELALEVLMEGTTKEWPRDTDFRQWALDQRGA